MRINSNRNLLIGQTTNNTSNDKLQITNSSTDGRALQLTTLNHVVDFAYCQINNVNRSLSKAFEVQLSGVPKFYVRGDGTNVFPSDRRLKTDILALESPLQKLLALNCYSYKFIDEIANGNAQTRVGLIAQEVEEIIPTLVTTDEQGMKGLDYISFIPYLIGALQTQNTKIEELQAQLNNCCAPTALKASAKNQIENKQINRLSENQAYIEQNQPNPFNKESVIHAFIPIGSESASILIFDLNGKLLKTYLI